MTIKKRTGNESPRPILGKTHKYSRLVRFVDINDYADRIINFLKGDIVKVTTPEYNVKPSDSLVYVKENTTINLPEALKGESVTIKNGKNTTTKIQALEDNLVEGQKSIVLTQSNASVYLVAVDEKEWIII